MNRTETRLSPTGKVNLLLDVSCRCCRITGVADRSANDEQARAGAYRFFRRPYALLVIVPGSGTNPGGDQEGIGAQFRPKPLCVIGGTHEPADADRPC